MTFLARIRLVTFAMILGLVASSPAIAQKLGPDGAPNPTASVTSERDLLKQVPRAEGRIDIPDTKASGADPARRTDVGLFPRGPLALGRRDRDPRHDRGSGRRLSDHGAAAHYGRALRPEDCPLQSLRALLALADRGVLCHSRPDRSQHHLRENPAFANRRPRHVLGYFAGRQVRAQLHQLLLRGRPRPDHRDLLQGQYSGEGRSRLAQAGRRLHQEQACPRRPVQSRREGCLLAFGCRRRCGLGVGLCFAVPLLSGPTSPTCRSRRSCTPLSPFCSSP